MAEILATTTDHCTVCTVERDGPVVILTTNPPGARSALRFASEDAGEGPRRFAGKREHVSKGR
jgi:hypothetical protein